MAPLQPADILWVKWGQAESYMGQRRRSEGAAGPRWADGLADDSKGLALPRPVSPAQGDA